MGIIFSKNGGDYERILSDLDSQIKRVEILLEEQRAHERRLTVILFFYSLLFYLFLFLYIFFYPRASGRYQTITDLAMLVGYPIIIYYSRRLMAYYFWRKACHRENALRTLRARQKLKVEELKKATSYYQTRGLIERFDPELRPESTEKSNGGGSLKASGDINVPQPGENPPGMLPVEAKNSFDYTSRHPSFSQSMDQLSMASTMGVPLTFSPPPPPPTPTWMDRLVDALIGDDGRNFKYALVCGSCFAHNGLAPPNEFETIQYSCPNCGYFNLPRKKSSAMPVEQQPAMIMPPPIHDMLDWGEDDSDTNSLRRKTSMQHGNRPISTAAPSNVAADMADPDTTPQAKGSRRRQAGIGRKGGKNIQMADAVKAAAEHHEVVEAVRS